MMAGAGAAVGSNPPKPSSSSKPTAPPPSSSAPQRKSRFDKKPSDLKVSNNPNPKPINNPSPKPDLNNHFGLPTFPFREPPPPPAYGFHMLERRTIVLADGSVRSYFALPADYQDFPPVPNRLGFDAGFTVNRNNQDYRNPPLGLDGPHQHAMKRKLGDEGINGGLERLRQQVLEHGSASSGDPSRNLYMGRGTEEMVRPAKHMRAQGSSSRVVKHSQVDQTALKKSFLHIIKSIYENANLKKTFLADGKQGRLQCLACTNRSSKDIPDMHSLIMHAYNPDSGDSLVEHLAFHKALCVVMGWNYSTPPDNSKSYQILSADEAVANRDDLILWPPLVIIHNTLTGKRPDGLMEGVGNKFMDNYLRDIGFPGGKSKALYSRGGHQGVTLVKFASDQSGLTEATRLAEYFEKENHGRKSWARLQALTQGKDDENNPNLCKVDHRSGEKKRIFYGYLGTVTDLEMVDFDLRKKITIDSRSDYKSSG